MFLLILMRMPKPHDLRCQAFIRCRPLAGGGMKGGKDVDQPQECKIPFGNHGEAEWVRVKNTFSPIGSL